MTEFVKCQANKYYNAFNLIDGLGPVGFKKLLAHFHSLAEAWSADLIELRKAGLENSVLEQIKKQKPSIDPDLEMEKLEKHQVQLVTLEDKNYPKILKEIYHPPAVLYLRGSFQPADEFSLGIVGTRRLTGYGQQVTPLIATDLARAGLSIVSGLAKGIDTLAHQAALKTQGRTIAVLGSGLDKPSIYPRVNQNLADQITEQGAVISEFPPGTLARPQHFPQRNRIISGLSLGVLVVEAPEKSGALITAREALEQNRDVFAIPGSLFSENSSGTNNLIKMGAKLVTEANDILQELNLSLLTDFQRNKKIIPANPEEALIIKQLSDQPLHIDKLAQQTKLPIAVLNSTLVLMEMKGKVRNLGANNYVMAR